MPAVCEEILKKEHEQVSFFQDRATGLSAIIAIHDTSIGPALGGCRMRKYVSYESALADVLNLSEAMSFKNALCGIPFGGGKSVIIADSTMTDGREAFFRQFGRVLESLGGKYITAEDMGTSVADMMNIAKETKHVTGRDPECGGVGNPSPWTAEGVFEGMKACLERKFGSDSFENRHVVVQGVGQVGAALVRHLRNAGAKVTMTDVHTERTLAFASDVGATFVSPAEIFQIECDVFAPCATGGAINPETVSQLKCKIVAGAANNQIAGAATERELIERGVFYAPDFAINAGGVILCAEEFESDGFNAERVHARILKIRETVGSILDESLASGKTPGEVAVNLARQRIVAAR